MRSGTIWLILIILLSRPVAAQSISYIWFDKIYLAKELLKVARLEHSNQTVTYVRKIKLPPAKSKSRFKRKTKVKAITYTDYAWKEIALAVMDTDNGNFEIVRVTKEGQKLINNSPKFEISVEERASGLTWNGKNTAFIVRNKDSGYVVIANKWIERLKNGDAKEHIYTPFSTALYQEELIAGGEAHLKSEINFALGQLGSWGVGSLVFKHRTLGDAVPSSYLRNIALTEHTDPQEFYSFLEKKINYDPFKRVLVLIAANGEQAYSETRSGADALGLHQFTEATWSLMKKTYPDAQLPSFEEGAGNHVASLRAAALLYDYNLSKLTDKLGTKILQDKNLMLYVAAAHNCGVDRVIKAVKRPGKDWRKSLRKLGKTDETLIFIEKMEYLKNSN